MSLRDQIDAAGRRVVELAGKGVALAGEKAGSLTQAARDRTASAAETLARRLKNKDGTGGHDGKAD